MAKFLTTSGISYHLEEIIKRANEKVVIISPYLKINDRLKGLLTDKDLLRVDIRVVYGKNELQPGESTWLQGLNSIRTTFLENLHAKCYLNENEAIITSMNLYEFSQRNNEEMGILVSREDDPELYREIDDESRSLIRRGEEVNLIVKPVIPSSETQANSAIVSAKSNAPKHSAGRKRRASTATLERPSTGYCIRGGDSLAKADESKPLCFKHWRSWNRRKKDDHPEKFCHFCGQESATSKGSPLCPDCCLKYKSILTS